MGDDPFIFFTGHAEDEAADERQNAIESASHSMDPIRILILEDEEAHFHLMKRTICKELPEATVCHASDASACLGELERIAPDIILIDYLLPGMTGIEFLAAIKQKGCDIPIIMITGQGDESIAIQAMKLGAQDYLVKSADFFLLLPAVIGQAVRERRLKLNLRKTSRLNALLLDSLPYPAMLISPERVVLAANRISQQMGARVGGCCWQNFRLGTDSDHRFKAEGECSFCMVDKAFRLGKAVNSPELTVEGRIWDIWWIPIDPKVCLNYAIDITERKRVENKLRMRSRFLEIANRDADMRCLLESFVQEIKNATGCRAAAIRISNDQTGAPFIAGEGCDPHSLLAAAAESTDSDRAASGQQSGVSSIVSTPVRLGERVLGSIYLADAPECMLPSEIIEIVTTAAMNLAAAAERIVSGEQLKKSEQALRFLSDRLIAAQEEERTRISRELHDSIGSLLCAIRLSIENFLEGYADTHSLQNTVALTQDTLEEVRRIITDLRPSILDDLGIIAALSWFCTQFMAIHPGIEIKQQIRIKEHEIPEPLKIVIFRIVQESFNNIAKYSQADAVTLDLFKKEGDIQLCVQDNGTGFDLHSAALRKDTGHGMGLVSMKERVEISGGVFSLDSCEGEGTIIMASWPPAESAANGRLELSG